MTPQEAQAALDRFYDALQVPVHVPFAGNVRDRGTGALIAYFHEVGADQFAKDIQAFGQAIATLAAQPVILTNQATPGNHG